MTAPRPIPRALRAPAFAALALTALLAAAPAHAAEPAPPSSRFT